jgi:hypothetical protein
MRRGLTIAAGLVVLLLTVLGGVASANHSFFQQISVGQTGGNGFFPVIYGGASADGSKVFFGTAEQLDGTDADTSFDTYERSAGTTKRVSVGQINGNGVFGAFFNGASADGTRVFFTTSEPLVATDTDGNQDIYERSAGTTKRVSAGQVNGNGVFDVSFRRASANGTRVFFETSEKLVGADTDTETDIYERSGGGTKRVSAGQINGSGAFAASFNGASADGTRIFFATFERLVAADTDSVQDIYERSGGTTKLVSAGQINGNGPTGSFFGIASADGTRVFFATQEQLVAGDTDSSFDTYERSGGTTTLVSAGQINGNGAFDAFLRGASADGTRVFFETQEKLIGADTDSNQDVYERSAGTTKRVSAGQVNGNGAFGVLFRGASADGKRVFFTTSEQLVGTDSDGGDDIYERVGSTTKLVSAGQINGNNGDSANFVGTSADGTRVFFTTLEQLVGTDSDFAVDIYERSAGTTTKLSPGNVSSFPTFNGASADGTAVFYSTSEPLLDDTDSLDDIYGAYVAP